MTSDSHADPAFSHGELMAVGFLVAFFRRSLHEAPPPGDRVVNWLELAEARLPAIIGRLRGDSKVLDNGRRFHDLAEEYLPRVVRERESFIELLENLAGLEERVFARDAQVASVESENRLLRHRVRELEARIASLEPPDAQPSDS